MGDIVIEGVILTPLNIVDVSGGDVLHAMKAGDSGFYGFGEAYFSKIESGAIKAWKRHRKMVLNLIVPVGEIRFVVVDDRNAEKNVIYEVVLSAKNYCRLTVPPMIWIGFQGLGAETSMLLNISSIPHDPDESDKKNIDEIEYDWGI